MATTMRVYRWQNVLGIGPYQCVGQASLEEESGYSHDIYNNCPPPYEDGIDGVNGRVFGFASIEQAARWFRPKAQAAMRKRGLALYWFDVNYPAVSVKQGRCQLCFERKAVIAEGVVPEDGVVFSSTLTRDTMLYGTSPITFVEMERAIACARDLQIEF